MKVTDSLLPLIPSTDCGTDSACPATNAGNDSDNDDDDQSLIDAVNEDWGEPTTDAETSEHHIFFKSILTSHGIGESWDVRFRRVVAPKRMFKHGEIAGCLGDLGTFLPDVRYLVKAYMCSFLFSCCHALRLTLIKKSLPFASQ